MPHNYFQMCIPTKIIFGSGQLNKLHKQKMPGKKAVVVISEGKSTRVNGYLAKTEEQLKMAGVSFILFDKIQANPFRATVMEGAAFARDNQCDFIVALGGGSCIDASKAIALMATNEGDLWDYMVRGSGKGKTLLNKPLPLVAIPTTAGTGSEVDPWAVVTDPVKHEKMGLGNENTFPFLSVIDPELTISVPPVYTAFQGFDALFHSAESYVSTSANLLSDTLTLSAIRHIAGNLAKCVRNGNDIAAREKVAYGNTLSGMVESIGSVTSMHSLEHAMSAFHQDLPHGAGLIMISKAYFSHFIDKHICDERFVRMTEAMGMDNAKRPEDFITALEKLQQDCGVAELKMSSYGIKPDEFASLAKNARDTMGHLFERDPIKLSAEDCVAIFRASFK